MSTCRKIRLGDACKKIGSGSTPRGGATVYVSSGTAFIRSQNVYNLRFEVDGLTYITEDAARRLDGVSIYEDDILINITGDSVARTCIVPSAVLPARVSQHVAIIRPCQDYFIPKYLNYYMASPYMQAYMLGLAVGKGSSRNAMTKAMIEDFEIPCPSIQTQKRIVAILSRYDNLIENYQKQIKLLEEAAQRLYKEWFIDLRFPGHEQVKIVDGVPEGWEKTVLNSIVEFKRGKTVTQKDIITGDIPVVAGGLSPAYYCNKHNTSNRVITISASGANAGFTKMYYERIWASDCSFIDNRSTSIIHFVYCYLLASKDNILNMQKGSAQPHVYAKDINIMPLLKPNAVLLQSFEQKATEYFNMVEKLKAQSKILTEARDRLLPKLMSGEIEV